MYIIQLSHDGSFFKDLGNDTWKYVSWTDATTYDSQAKAMAVIEDLELRFVARDVKVIKK
jgi:DNA-directed RNA polymerase delta subunit